MENFFINSILWVLALYGLFELIRQIIYMITYTNMKADGIYIIIAVKNQEERIEGFLRSVLFKILYGKEENIKDIRSNYVTKGNVTFTFTSCHN